MPGRSTIVAIFLLIIHEICHYKKRDLQSVYLLKHMTVYQDILWCLLKKGVHIKFINVLNDMFVGAIACKRAIVGYTKKFP